MNKKDTFDLLKRVSFNQIRDEWDEHHGFPSYEWYEERGWTPGEFNKEWHAQNKKK